MRPFVIEPAIEQCASALAHFAAALFVMLVSPVTPASAAQVTSEDAACNLAKARVAAVGHFDQSVIAFCDFIVEEEQPEGLYVLALHSRRDCDSICSTNMGWFAIEQATGRVFEWDVADWKLGPAI